MTKKKNHALTTWRNAQTNRAISCLAKSPIWHARSLSLLSSQIGARLETNCVISCLQPTLRGACARTISTMGLGCTLLHLLSVELYAQISQLYFIDTHPSLAYILSNASLPRYLTAIHTNLNYQSLSIPRPPHTITRCFSSFLHWGLSLT